MKFIYINRRHINCVACSVELVLSADSMYRNRREGIHPASLFGAQHQPPRSVSAAAYAAGDDGSLTKRKLGGSRSSEVKSSAKVVQDPGNGRNHVVWVVSDGDLEQQQQSM